MCLNKTRIGWVINPDRTPGFTWNVITGCLHGCPYCYARDIAGRFKPKHQDGDKHHPKGNGLHEVAQKGQPFKYGFEPTFHAHRLREPEKIKESSTIFAGSMSDIFGDWVPGKWIEQILDTVRKCPQHTFLFLTKNGKKMCLEGDVVNTRNAWYGQSHTGSPDSHVFYIPNTRHFISLEPLIGGAIPDITGIDTNWVIIGSLNRNGKAVPPDKGGTRKEWVLKAIEIADKSKIPVFIKNELLELYPELPNRKDIPYMDVLPGTR